MPATPIPLLPGPWRPLPPGHAAGFTLRLGRLLSAPRSHEALAPHHRISGLRAMPLSFFPGWALVEGEATVEDGVVGTFDVLYGPGLMWLVDGDSRVLNNLTAGRVPAELGLYLEGAAGGDAASGQSQDAGGFLRSPLRELDPETSGPDFLRFYCACVWGEEGPFMPVESADSPALRGADATAGAAWGQRIRPIVMTLEGEDLVADGVIAYGRSLYETRLRIRDGTVRMEDDAVIAADVLPSRAHAAPLRDLRRLQE